jgi:hypothetical protein
MNRHREWGLARVDKTVLARNAESVFLVGVAKDCAFAYISAIPGWLGWSRERTGVDGVMAKGAAGASQW